MDAENDAAVELPPLLWHTAYPSLSAWIDALYWQYEAMVSRPGLSVRGRRIFNGSGTAADGRDVAFWHLITGSTSSGAQPRTLSLYRGAMLGRVWQVLEWASEEDPRAVSWSASAAGGARLVVVAPADYSLKIVLRERRARLALVTAYPALRTRENRCLRQEAAAAG